MDDLSKLKDPSPWHPIKNSVDLKHLGKLAEELGEAGAAVARCIIQGIDEKEPVTEVPNQQWLENELADVIANIDLVCDRFKLDKIRMAERSLRKKKHLTAWHDMA